MKKIFSKSMIVAVVILAGSTFARADIRIKQRQDSGGRTSESEVAIKGKRQRSEMELGPGMKIVSIMQCDLRRTLTISDANRKYMIASMDSSPTGNDSASPINVPTNSATEPTRKGGIVTYTTTTTDTGERKQMFGFTARHVKTSMVTESSPDACNQEKMKFESDGWYIDLEIGLDCMAENAMAMTRMSRPGGCRDQVRNRRLGSGKLGYPVKVTTRMFDADGNESFTSTTEVIELTRVTLDPALFEIPAGYTEAASMQEIYAPSVGDVAGGMGGGTGGSMPGGVASAAAAMTTAASSKKPGMIRIGVVGLNNRTSESIEPESLRQKLIGGLMGSGLDAVAIYGKSPSEVTAEAKQKECDFVLYTDVTNLKQSSANKVGGFLGRAAGVGAAVKDRFESQVDFRLLPTGGETPKLQSKANVKEDGDANASVSAALDREAKAVSAAVKK
jgi:hypothetical protein